MTAIRFALIGCGTIAPTHARAIRQLGDRAELACCTDVVATHAADFAAEFDIEVRDYEAIIADGSIQAVVVCTPSGSHADVGVPALLAGKHVLLEKPMDVTVEACDRLLEAQRVGGALLGVVFQNRFDDAAQLIRNALLESKLGEMVFVDCRVPWFRTQAYYDSGDWRGTWRLDGGGSLMNQGIHTLDLMRWMCGPVKSVYAKSRIAAHQRIEVEDLLCATVVFENDSLGSVVTATSLYPGFPARLAIHGTSGSAVIEGGKLQTLALQGQEIISGHPPGAQALRVAAGGTETASRAADHGSITRIDSADVWGEGHRRLLSDFVDAIDKGRQPLINGVDGRNAVALVRAIYQSASVGEVVWL